MRTFHIEFQGDSTEMKEHDCDFIRLIRTSGCDENCAGTHTSKYLMI